MKDLTNYEIEKFGIYNKHTIMDNGELRFRLISNKDNSSYIRTEANERGGLQNSHYHKFFREMYIVQSGCIIVYELKNSNIIKTILNKGEYFVTDINIPHNIYMYPNSITHTVKFGECNDNDWYACEELDKLLENTIV